MNKSPQDIEVADDEIDLTELIKKIWDRRTFIVKTVLVCMCIGLVVALLTPKEYTASVVFVPQTSSGNSGGSGLGGLASLAGINLGGAGGDGQEIGPELYPKLASDVKFKKSLINAPIHPEGSADSVTYAQYYQEIYKPGALILIKKYTIGLPGLILKAVRGESRETRSSDSDSNLIFISEQELESFKVLESQLNILSNKKEGYVEISFTMPEPVLAAEMALAAQRQLQEEVIAFRIRNAQEQLEFAEKQYLEKQQEFNAIHARLAAFRDRNRNMASSFGESEEQKLEAEFSLKVSIYTEMAKQLEQAKLQVKKDTPVFSNIQSVSVPTQKSSISGLIILIVSVFIGIFVALAWIGISELMKGMKGKLEVI
jgi:uncharacterized protein involved in exopolysaccharide biosynthesis